MDPLPAKWSFKLEMDDPAAIIQDWQMNCSIDESVNNSFLSFSNPSALKSCLTYPLISTTPQDAFQTGNIVRPSTKIISFGNVNSPVEGRQNGASEYGLPIKKGTRTGLQAKDHVLAERKRRRNLSQKFISLSALVPGLKKLDKSSVIDGAIRHLKELEERLKMLEEGTKIRKDDQEPSVVTDKLKPHHYSADQEVSASATENSNSTRSDQSLAKVEVRISEANVLIRSCCRRRAGFSDEFLCKMEKLGLSLTSSRFMPFGDNMLAIAAVAKMNDGFCMTQEDLANNIRLSIFSEAG